MGSIKASPIVSHFFIFNPDYGKKEGEEHKKLLFYFPKDESLNIKVQNIGFCEAVVKFSETFASPNSHNSDHGGAESGSETSHQPHFHQVSTEKLIHVYNKFEDDFLIGMAMNRSRAAEQKYVLYPEALNQLCRTSYNMFRLFFGTFRRILKREGGVEALKLRLDYFFTRYLSTMKVYSMPLLDCFNGIQFLSLDSTNFLRVETLISEILEVFPQIKKTIFLYQDQLLWYTVPRDELATLYRYLTQNLLPMSLRAELQPEAQRKMANLHHHGKFVTGPTDGLDRGAIYQSMHQGAGSQQQPKKGEANKLPVVFLKREKNEKEELSANDDDESEAFHLVVYRALNGSLALLIPAEEQLDMDFYRNLDTLLGPQLTQLASTIGDLYAKQVPTNIGIDQHFVFYNPLNLAVRSTFLETVPEGSKLPTSVPPEIISLVCEIREETLKSDYLGDVLAKSDSEWWVVGKRANGRELFLVMAQRHANLTEIHEEVKRICHAHFENLFLME